MASGVGVPSGRQTRFASEPSSKKGKESIDNEARKELTTKQDYVDMLGDEIFEAFARRRDEALRAAAELRKMMMLTRHSVRYIDSHERSLSNEFQKFLEFAEQQRKIEARRAKLLGLPPQSSPVNMFSVRPAGSFGIPPPEKRKPEDVKDRRTRSKMFLKIQMERIQNIRVARTTRPPKGTPPLQTIDLSSAARKTPGTPRRPTQFSAEFLQDEPPHYALASDRGRPATAPAETQGDLYRWMTDFFREHVPNESGDTVGCRSGSRMSLKDAQVRDEQMQVSSANSPSSLSIDAAELKKTWLDQLCSIASATPSYIAVNPWNVSRKSISQPTSRRGSRFNHLHSPVPKQSKHEMKIDLELAAQLEARRMENMRKRTPHQRSPSLGKRKRRPQTAASSPRPASRKMFLEDTTDTILNSSLFFREAGVEEVSNVRYICLANKGIGNVISQELASFTSLRCLDLSGNHVSLMSLAALTALRKLNLLGNQQSELKIPEGSFQELEILDVSYNLLKDTALTALSLLPSLRKLNVNNNKLKLIPPEATEAGAFVRLERLSVARNNLTSTCLVSLSKLPWLETLNLHKNRIKCIPDEIALVVRAFSRLETLDLGHNPINYHHNFITLEKMQKLRKVFLWDTPLSRTVTYDGSGKCSRRSMPILQAAMRAQKVGQNWYLVKTDKLVKEGWYSDKLTYAVHDNGPPGMSPHEKLKARLEKSTLVEEVQKAMLRNTASDRKYHLGTTSLVAESPETKEAELFIADSRKLSLTKGSPRRQAELEEQVKILQNAPSLAEPYLSQAEAAVATARKASRMTPREVKGTTQGQRQSSTQILLGGMDWKNASNTRKKSSTYTPRKRSLYKSKHGA